MELSDNVEPPGHVLPPHGLLSVFCDKQRHNQSIEGRIGFGVANVPDLFGGRARFGAAGALDPLVTFLDNEPGDRAGKDDAGRMRRMPRGIGMHHIAAE